MIRLNFRCSRRVASASCVASCDAVLHSHHTVNIYISRTACSEERANVQTRTRVNPCQRVRLRISSSSDRLSAFCRICVARLSISAPTLRIHSQPQRERRSVRKREIQRALEIRVCYLCYPYSTYITNEESVSCLGCSHLPSNVNMMLCLRVECCACVYVCVDEVCIT